MIVQLSVLQCHSAHPVTGCKTPSPFPGELGSNESCERHFQPRPHTPTFSAKQSMLLQEEIEALLSKKVIVPVPPSKQTGLYSNLFLVLKKDGRFCLVINLRALNVWAQQLHFKMEGLHILHDLIEQNCWFTKVARPEGCLLHHSSKHQPSMIPAIFSGRERVSVQLPSVQSVMCPLGVHKDDELIASNLRSQGVQMHG